MPGLAAGFKRVSAKKGPADERYLKSLDVLHCKGKADYVSFQFGIIVVLQRKLSNSVRT